MTDIALSKIANLIKVEDDLVKVASLRQQFIKEKASIDLKLSTTTQLQIDSIMTNLSRLNNAALKLNTIKQNIGTINQVHDDSITNIKDYATIKKMTQVNQFMAQVMDLYRDISQFKTFLDRLNRMIAEETKAIQDSLVYRLNNFFTIHYLLTQARNFQDYLELDTTSISDDLQSIIQRIVNPIKKSIRLFDELLVEIITSLTESVKDGNIELIFKLVKVIEFETTEDTKFTLMESLGLNSQRDLKSINYSNFRGARRNYKKFFYDKLEESLDETFNGCIDHFAHDKMAVYDNLEWLEDELLFVNEKLNPLFPNTWEISSFIQNVYYNRLHKFTMEVIKTDPPAEDLMRILSYDSHYGKFMTQLQTASNRKSVIKKDQKSIIGEDLKNLVLEDYLKVITIKMEEWNQNLIKQETKAFHDRESPPDVYNYHQVIEDLDANDEIISLEVDTDVFVLPDFKTPLTMLKEQSDVAADSGYSKILVGVIENWSRGYNVRIENYRTIIEEEYLRYMAAYNNDKYLVTQSKLRRMFKRTPQETNIDIDNMTPDELATISKPGFIEYLTALGNTFELNTDRLQDKFLPFYKDKVHANYHDRIIKAFEDTLNPSTELISQIIRHIVEIIVNDLFPALSAVFTKSWYEDGNATTNNDSIAMATKIVETIGEYMEELRSYTSYDIYQVTFNILLDTFIASYIKFGYANVLKGDGKKIDPNATKKYKSFAEAISRDTTIFYGSLEPLLTRKDREYLFSSLSALEFMSDLATCEQPMKVIPQIWENDILNVFYYCSVDYVKGICLCRKDMDKSQVNELIPILEEIKKNHHLNVEPPTLPIGALTDFLYES
ncbi:exocyst complex subunit [Suhomyces tanzawaensis NRRL Y-17324]|uniref:Exocyst complex subunit n=1 Tax=Suhomyces tanzawaensis NRRL Y-17324 TaxID=984487 RepID=A0A1E4SG28_9ASCO|nr:exocyst complex subunit [Suhomyces tanzawaensis NRRL Y-17324]ODV78362.1 exocyst complex subunit [Suhomyces tanzawaensis NRRL Y-17324]